MEMIVNLMMNAKLIYVLIQMMQTMKNAVVTVMIIVHLIDFVINYLVNAGKSMKMVDHLRRSDRSCENSTLITTGPKRKDNDNCMDRSNGYGTIIP